MKMELTIPTANRINPKACQKESNPHRIKQSLLHDDFIHSKSHHPTKKFKTCQERISTKKVIQLSIQVSLHEHHIGDQR